MVGPRLVAALGRPKVMLESKRDSRAGSRSCLRLVAASTTVRAPWAKPSIWRSSTPSVRLVASCISELRATGRVRRPARSAQQLLVCLPGGPSQVHAAWPVPGCCLDPRTLRWQRIWPLV